MNDATEVIVGDGKYTVVHTNGAGLRALRYGEPWRDLTGDGLVMALVQEIEELRSALQSQKPETSDVMLSGVLRIPFDMAMATEISRVQFYHRAQQALNELEALQHSCKETSQDREDAERWRYIEGLWDNSLTYCEISTILYFLGISEENDITTQTAKEIIDSARRIEEEAKP